MNAAELHKDAIVIDGLVCGKMDLELFQDMQKGGVTTASCTMAFWENFQGTVNNIAGVNKIIDENPDMLLKVRTTDDIRRAKAEERAGALCKEAGAKRALPLPVSVPSHCALMKPAAEKLAKTLATLMTLFIVNLKNQVAGVYG